MRNDLGWGGFLGFVDVGTDSLHIGCSPSSREFFATVFDEAMELPFGRNRAFLKAVPKAVDFVLGGWQMNGIATFQTSTPLQIGNGGNNTNLGSPGQRPNNNGKSAKKDGPIDQRLNSYFDQSVFS